jgi:hypothetical protein
VKPKRLRLVSTAQKPEVRDISDKSKLLWASYFGPIQSAVAQLNAAITNTNDVVARSIMEAEGVSPEEWVFDMATVKLTRRPKAG